MSDFSIVIRGSLPPGMSRAKLTSLARAAFLRGGGKGAVEMSVSVVSDAVIRRLNRQYRGKDKVTDVLSFGMDGAAGLGDIFICLPQVRRQARTIGRSAASEFALMVVHGTLHLMGYDHATLVQERRMFGLQHEVLERAGYL
jgi:probable rRNA maturation factor